MEPFWILETGARAIPESHNLFLANDFGACGDGVSLCTAAIQAAVDAAAEAGGGKVTFSPGKYLSGTIRMKSMVNLDIPQGTTLVASENPNDYPEVFTRHAGIEMLYIAPLILVDNCRNAAVTGNGVIDGQGRRWWNLFLYQMLPDYEKKGLRWCVDYDCRRPKILVIQNSENVVVQGIRFQRSPHWTIHVLYSSYVTVDNVEIMNNIDGRGPSTDGIDIDSSEFVRVSHCLVDCNDDNFCLKSGRDADGLRVNRPCRNILIEHCRALSGRGLVTIGSETAGGISDILVRNCSCEGTDCGIRFKSTSSRGGYIHDIAFEEIDMESTGIAIEMDLDWFPEYSNCTLADDFRNASIPSHWKALLKPVIPPERGIPVIEDISFRGIKAKNAENCCQMRGTPLIRPRRLHFQDVSLQGKRGGFIIWMQADDVHNFSIASPVKTIFDNAETLEKSVCHI